MVAPDSRPIGTAGAAPLGSGAVESELEAGVGSALGMTTPELDIVEMTITPVSATQKSLSSR